jgi:hypothetical protein
MSLRQTPSTESAVVVSEPPREEEEEDLPLYITVKNVELSAADIRLYCRLPAPHRNLVLPVRFKSGNEAGGRERENE